MSVLNVNDKRPVSSFRKKLKHDQAAYNPCIEEYNSSLKCLEKNHYERNKCTEQFVNYRKCNKIWRKIITIRREKDIKPVIPAPEERAKVKNEFLESEN
ncbi:Coiled-coil-helix-coiled-coil-helix domain-containing protein 7, partial [Eufriesea mexicana]